MNERAEKFRRQLQKELGLTVGPKDPILAEFLAQEEFREEMAAEHQRMLIAFEEALAKNQASWSDSAKNLANQSLNAALDKLGDVRRLGNRVIGSREHYCCEAFALSDAATSFFLALPSVGPEHFLSNLFGQFPR